MSVEVPHERIRASEDRSWTLRLLEIACDGDGPAWARLEAIESLGRIEDDRSVEPLRALVDETSETEAVRLAAVEALAELEPPSTESERRAWWASPDPVQQRRALWAAERTEADLLLPVACDHDHPLRVDALASMAFGFDQPRFHAALIAALDDGTPPQQLAAAQTLLWDQPIAAEPALLRAAAGSDEPLALAAIDTLRYYDSQSAFLGLRAVAASAGPGPVGNAAVAAADEIGMLLADIGYPPNTPAGVAAYERWLEPVSHLLAHDDDADAPAAIPGSEPSEPDGGAAAAEIARALADPNASRAPLRAALRAESSTPQLSEADRRRLRPLLLHQADAPIRDLAAGVFRAWGDRDALVDLALDRHTTVRKSAIFALGELAETPDPTVAAIAWDVSRRTTGMASKEALHTYALHGERAEVLSRLLDLARGDERDETQLAAVHTLSALGARREIGALLPRLAEPPRVTWALHTLLLDAAAQLDLPLPDTGHLLDADSAALQYALAAARTRRAG